MKSTLRNDLISRVNESKIRFSKIDEHKKNVEKYLIKECYDSAVRGYYKACLYMPMSCEYPYYFSKDEPLTEEDIKEFVNEYGLDLDISFWQDMHLIDCYKIFVISFAPQK